MTIPSTRLPSLADLIKIFVAGTFSADIVLPSGGINIERKMTNNKILAEQELEPEPEPQPKPEPEPEPVLACQCGIELPKKLKIIGGTAVLRVGFPLYFPPQLNPSSSSSTIKTTPKLSQKLKSG